MSPTEPERDEAAVQALIQAYVACRIAIEALPRLPGEIRQVIEDPVRTVCDVVGPELDRIRPGATSAVE